jgi:hypothetical protein
VISSAGVTSKAGLKTSASGGVIVVPVNVLSSSGARVRGLARNHSRCSGMKDTVSQ